MQEAGCLVVMILFLVQMAFERITIKSFGHNVMNPLKHPKNHLNVIVKYSENWIKATAT